MKVKVTIAENGVAIVEPKVSLVGGDEIDELKKEVQKLIDIGNKKLIIDLANVDYMNSSAIGVLVSFHTSYVNRSGKIIISNVGKSINNIFVITKLSSIFNLVENTKDAIASFSK